MINVWYLEGLKQKYSVYVFMPVLHINVIETVLKVECFWVQTFSCSSGTVRRLLEKQKDKITAVVFCTSTSSDTDIYKRYDTITHCYYLGKTACFCLEA